MLGTCTNCSKIKQVGGDGKSKGLCKVCYKKLLWKPKSVICKRCKRSLPMHAIGLCIGCYNSVFHIEKVRESNARRYHGISTELYRKLVERCLSCKFDKIVEIHHLDHNHKNNSENNLVGLCSNCHRMLHSKKYQKEVFEVLRSKGYNPPQGYEMDGFFKK